MSYLEETSSQKINVSWDTMGLIAAMLLESYLPKNDQLVMDNPDKGEVATEASPYASKMQKSWWPIFPDEVHGKPKSVDQNIDLRTA